MTLGCGAMAGNITSDNIGPLHLINIKRLAYAVRRPEEAFEVSAGAGCRGHRIDAGRHEDRSRRRWSARRGKISERAAASRPAAQPAID